MLTHLQKDALTEILNVQLGSAASMLSEMVDQKIILSVPELELLKGDELNNAMIKQGDLSDAAEFIITTVKFGDKFNGTSAIMFPQDKARGLVNACLGNELNQNAGQRLSAEDVDVIKEICNIMLNAILGEFGNILELKLEYTSLETEFSLDPLGTYSEIPENSEVLVLYTSFFLTESQLRGMIVIALTSESYQMLADKISSILESFDE